MFWIQYKAKIKCAIKNDLLSLPVCLGACKLRTFLCLMKVGFDVVENWHILDLTTVFHFPVIYRSAFIDMLFCDLQ